MPASDVALTDPARSAESSLAAGEVESIVRAAVGTLEPAYRDVLIAREEASEAEVAARLGISRANVKIRAHRARKQLRGVLAVALAMEAA